MRETHKTLSKKLTVEQKLVVLDAATGIAYILPPLGKNAQAEAVEEYIEAQTGARINDCEWMLANDIQTL